MRRRWRVPGQYDTTIPLNPPYPEHREEANNEATNTDAASSQAPSESEDSNINESYSGLFETLEPFVFFTPSDDTEQGSKERLVPKATIQFYRSLLLQQEQNVSINRNDSSPEFCRICRDTDSKENFLSPCRCKGTLALVHLSCLERWLAESDTSYCELCGHQYTTVRTPRYGVLKSIILWLGQGSTRDILFDVVAFCAFTPLAVVGTYLGIIALTSDVQVEEVLMPSVILISPSVPAVGIMAADTYYHQETSRSLNGSLSHFCARVVTVGLVSVMGAIDFAYLTWLFVRIQQHATQWYSWWRRNSVVKIILPPEVFKKPSSLALIADKLKEPKE